MAKDKKPQQSHQQNHAQGEKPEGPAKCVGPECKKKPARFSFCDEHYTQFKFGLITKDGHLAKDYERKADQYELFKKRQISKVA